MKEVCDGLRIEELILTREHQLNQGILVSDTMNNTKAQATSSNKLNTHGYFSLSDHDGRILPSDSHSGDTSSRDSFEGILYEHEPRLESVMNGHSYKREN